MNNNFYEIPIDWYSELNNNYMNNNNLADSKIALERGNLFNNLYEPYKNYQYRPLKPSNKKEELLYNILMYNFTLNELDLYLDLNPNNQDMLNLYNKYLNNKNELINEYERSFGPLTLSSENIASNNWNWQASSWPWEGTK